MGKYCVVCKCSSDKRPELIFHKFPKDERLRQTWLKQMEIKKEISKYATICSIHFSEQCFTSTIVSRKPILIRGSIPTILTEEELLRQETIKDENSSDSMNSNGETQNLNSENDMPQDSHSRCESFMIKEMHENISNQENISYETEAVSDFENLEEFTPPRELKSATEDQKMIEELQYSCRKIRVKGVKWGEFCRLPDTLKEMYWMEAQRLIEEQSREVKALQQKNRRYTTKIENLTLFTQSMKKEIAKRARKFKIEKP